MRGCNYRQTKTPPRRERRPVPVQDCRWAQGRLQRSSSPTRVLGGLRVSQDTGGVSSPQRTGPARQPQAQAAGLGLSRAPPGGPAAHLQPAGHGGFLLTLRFWASCDGRPGPLRPSLGAGLLSPMHLPHCRQQSRSALPCGLPRASVLQGHGFHPRKWEGSEPDL